MIRIASFMAAAVAVLALACSAPAQQTLLGTCSGMVGVETAPGSTLGNVYCTPAVAPPPAPTAAIAANPTTIAPGGSSTLTWSSTNATACAASGALSGAVPLSGTQTVSPTANATYTLTCNGPGGSAQASASVAVQSPPTGTCSLLSPAFCDTFNAGAVANNGRTGDLDPAKWTASRISGEIVTGATAANPQFVAPIPACRSTFTGTMVYSPQDTLICDPSGNKTRQLMTAAAIQNYGTNDYMILQPFDFAGRTGKIDFDVDAQLPGSASGYPEINITDQPVPATTFREFQNFEVGALPQNAIIVKFGNTCGNTTSAAPYNVMVYNNYQGTLLTPTVNGGCVQTTSGLLNHFEIQLSQTQISIYGSDASSDNVTFPNYKLLYQATISLPFSRGYVHVAARNHATYKYAGVLDVIYHWDNVGFDGPVLPALKAYEIADNTTVSTFTGDAGDPSPQPAKNLGYQLQDGTIGGKPAGMYDPVNLIPSLSFQNVNLSGVASAQLTLSAYANGNGNDTAHTPTTAWGISYSLNGGPFTTVNLTAAQIAGMQNNTSGYQGFWTPVINVPLSALVQGTNTVRFLPVGLPMDYAPVVANIDLLLTPGQQQTNACGIVLGGPAIFCEPFDVVNAGIPSRTGDLDPNVWGVSRFTGPNFAVGWFNGWNATVPILLCDGTTPNVTAPRDVQICNGQLREATGDNPSGVFDNGTVLVLAMYPKQPFDFAGRTGVVAFDVANDSFGSHSAWPEFWVTDLPIPAPFGVHFFNSLPPNGFGIRMAGMTPAGGQGGCPTNANVNKNRWTVDSMVVVRNYVWEDVNFQGYNPGTVSSPPLTMTINDCVIAPDLGSGAMNHVEFKINTNTVEVWATDAGVAATPTTLRKIATFTNANLSFTRGLVWIEDAHYNADKGPAGFPSQRNHTFVWDNVAFDGPFTYRDFSYDALDALVPDPALNTIDLGKFSDPNTGSSWNVLNMPANPQGTAARVMFNFFNQFLPNPTMLNITVNGHAHSVPWPYPDQTQNTWRTLAITIPLTDLVAGTNVVTIGSDEAQVTSNVNIVIVDVPGGVPVLPGNSRAYPQ